MPKGQWTPLTVDQEDKIKDEYLDKPVKRLATELKTTHGRIMRFLKKHNLEIPREVIEQRKIDSQRKKGCVPFNKGKKITEYMTPEAIENMKKTQYKKGNSPHNEKYDGHERITKDGYVEIRVRSGKYRLKHLLLWEKRNGTLPKSHCLKCVDGDRTNTNPNNWKLITRAENMFVNSKHSYPEEIIPSLLLINKINKQIKKKENVK